MPDSGNHNCAAVVQVDEPESQQGNDAREDSSEAPTVGTLPAMPSSTFNPDATPFVFNPRPSALNPLAEPFNPLSSSTASSAARPGVALSLQQPVLSAHSQPFEPDTTAPLVEPYCPVFSFDQAALDPTCWGSPAGTHAYLDVGAGSSLEQLSQLAQPTEQHAELSTTDADAEVQQVAADTARDAVDSASVLPTRPSAAHGLTLSQSVLCQQAMQHEHAVTRVRTAVHAEVVRALQHLTALPLSGPVAQTTKKRASTSAHAANSSQNANGNQSLSMKGAQDSSSPVAASESQVHGDFNINGSDAQGSAMSPRKGQGLRSQGAGGGSKAFNVAVESSGKAGTCEHSDLNQEAELGVVFMNKTSARAHADAITSHTHRAFQKVCSHCFLRVHRFPMGPATLHLDGSTAQADIVAVNYCKAIMVDVLATAASWRMWVFEQSVQRSGAREMLEEEHCRSLDAVHAAIQPAQSNFRHIDIQDIDTESNEEEPEPPGIMTSTGPPTVAPRIQHIVGAHAEPLSAVPWAASAGKPGYFLKQTRKAVLRLLQCAAEAGASLLLVADTPDDCASSAGISAASLDEQEEMLVRSTAQPHDQDSQSIRRLWDNDQETGDLPHDLDQETTEREYAAHGPFEGAPGARGDSSDQIHGEESEDDAQGRSSSLCQPSRVRVPSQRHDDVDVEGGGRRLRVAPRQPRPCLSPHAIPPASVSFASLVSPQATPCGRQPWSRHKDELRGREPAILGVLEPLHPLLKPVIIREPGVALGCALPNEANQHLTLTQQDGSEPLWRAGVYSSEVAQRGLHVDTVLDSRVAYVHCIVGPPSCMTAMNPGMAPVKAAARRRTTDDSAASNGAQTVQKYTDELDNELDKSTVNANGGNDEEEASVMISAWALAGVLINGRRIEHNEYDELCHLDRLTLVPHSTVGPALNYIFRAGDPTMALIPPCAAAAALLPPLHSVPLCQICGDLPHECLELQPCGHTFCAVCLSHRFAAVLRTGAHLTCPHGCPRPENIDRCMEVDMLVASLPEYLPRLARVIDWRPQSRRDVSTGDAATPRAPGMMPRSPNWGGASQVSEDSPLYTPLRAVDSQGSERGPEATASPFERFVESLGPDVWPHTPQRTGSTMVTRALPGGQQCTFARYDFSAQDQEPVAPPVLPSARAQTTACEEPSGASGARARPLAISELVPLSKEMTPLPMQELYAQQADVSARVIKVAASSNCESTDLRLLVRHFYVIAHATTAGPLWKDELNRSGTVEDAAAVVRAVVTAAKQGATGPDSMGGRAGQQVLCAVASMICALVLAQLPGSEEVCQGNQWRAARAHVVEALVGALEAWPNSDLTCHATLQCLVALCKDNAMMKANMTVTALKPVLHILHTCGSCSAIAERGFTLLAVLQAGGDHLNDGIRRLLIEQGLLRASIRALQIHSGGDERALTAVCFAVAMILRGGERWRESIKWRAARSALPKTIFMADKAYRQRCSNLGIPQDEALAALLAFLVLYLEPVQQKMRSRRKLVKRVLEWTGAVSLSAVTAVAANRMLR